MQMHFSFRCLWEILAAVFTGREKDRSEASSFTTISFRWNIKNPSKGRWYVHDISCVLCSFDYKTFSIDQFIFLYEKGEGRLFCWVIYTRCYM